MNNNAFDLIEDALRSGGPESGFEFLVQRFREEKNYPRLFEARLMRKRHEIGLPLIQVEPLGDLPEETRRSYDEAFIQAAREVGNLFLADGDIVRAWPYFRAIGETAPVASAIEQMAPREEMAPIIEIAFHEGAHPRKGFELILDHYGICRAITTFQQFPDRNSRMDCLRLLVRRVHHDLVDSLKRTIAHNEAQAPETNHISELIAGRDWLFEGNSYYIDTSHVVSIVQFSLELTDRETLSLALQLTDYGKHLSSLYQFRGNPPFENIYEDHGVYLRALLGEDVEGAIKHFREKIPEGDPNEIDSSAAQVLVGLLARLEHYQEAIEVSLQYFGKIDPGQLACPSVLQLCQSAGEYSQLMKIARERADLLNFAAGMVQGSEKRG